MRENARRRTLMGNAIRIMAILSAGTMSLPASAVQLYTATPLSMSPLSGSQGYGINAAGQVTGALLLAGVPTRHAFVWSNGAMTDLGALVGDYSEGSAINSAGQVAGCTEVASGQIHAFVWSNGAMTDLGTLGGTSSCGEGINASGQVTGGYFALGVFRAFLYSSGTMNDLGTLGGSSSSYAYAINDAGQVVGQSGNAFLYDGGTMRNLNDLVVAGPGGYLSQANGISDNGQVTGRGFFGSTYWHAFLYSGGTVKDLGTLGGLTSYGYAVNSSGQVVGVASVGGYDAAFLYSGGTMYTLNSLVVSGLNGFLTEATAINDNGQIVANACAFGGCTAYRLDPIVPASERAVLLNLYTSTGGG